MDEELNLLYAAESEVQEVEMGLTQFVSLPREEGATNLPSITLSHPVFEVPLSETRLVGSLVMA